jgi:DNA-binding IclR family transcriptional regulator
MPTGGMADGSTAFRTIADPQQLRAEIQSIQNQGVAIGSALPKTKFDADNVARNKRVVMEAAKHISDKLGKQI